MKLSTERDVPVGELASLYESVGWTAYTRDVDGLAQAVRNSTWVVTAWEDDGLIGLARGLSDDVSIFYLQDILVRPDWQGRGVGRALLDASLERFAHVRQVVLLTDDQGQQHAFYRSAGLRQAGEEGLAAFVRIRTA
jgi:GNAT superfamily N-acetyltransferase